MSTAGMLGQFAIALETLGWDKDDDISVEIGGVAVTGTPTSPDANPKWAKPFGTVSYQNDAFIVIKTNQGTQLFLHNQILNLNKNILIKEKNNERTRRTH